MRKASFKWLIVVEGPAHVVATVVVALVLATALAAVVLVARGASPDVASASLEVVREVVRAVLALFGW